MPLRTRSARPHESEAVSSLALRSKSHWQYTAEQLEVFRDELTIAPEQVAPKRTHAAEEAGVLLGFYTLMMLHEDEYQDEAELEHLFVEPGRLERGVGAAVFRHACQTARAWRARSSWSSAAKTLSRRATSRLRPRTSRAARSARV